MNVKISDSSKTKYLEAVWSGLGVVGLAYTTDLAWSVSKSLGVTLAPSFSLSLTKLEE